MFDFLKSASAKKNSGPTKAQGFRSVTAKGKIESRGSVKFDSFTFNVKEFNKKGFVLDPFDKDLLIKGQKFRFEIQVERGDFKMNGSAEAIVTRVQDNMLAAVFTSKPYDRVEE